jgi:hypothetical protein
VDERFTTYKAYVKRSRWVPNLALRLDGGALRLGILLVCTDVGRWDLQKRPFPPDARKATSNVICQQKESGAGEQRVRMKRRVGLDLFSSIDESCHRFVDISLIAAQRSIDVEPASCVS